MARVGLADHAVDSAAAVADSTAVAAASVEVASMAAVDLAVAADSTVVVAADIANRTTSATKYSNSSPSRQAAVVLAKPELLWRGQRIESLDWSLR